jgi:LPXTG-motif cell wall-anchored protein
MQVSQMPSQWQRANGGSRNTTASIATRIHSIAQLARLIRRRAMLAMVFVSLACMLAAFTGTEALGAAKVPPGNKGTVKIDNEFFDGIPNNVPHPGCDFHIQFFYFPRDTTATYTFKLIAPTKDGSTSGSVELDSTATPNADLLLNLNSFLTDSGVDPQPKQGFHVKLTIHAPGAIGADVKHKVFWIKCASSTTPPPPPPPGTPPSVLPKIVHNKKPQVLGTHLAKTGASPTGPLSVAGIAFVAIGAFLVWIGREKAEQFAIAVATTRPGSFRARKSGIGSLWRAHTIAPPRGPP